MTITATTPRLLWTGSGSTSSIALSVDGQPIVFSASSEIVAQQRIVASDTISALQLGVDYTITGGPVVSSSEPPATLNRIAGNLASGYEWVVTRVTPAAQSVDLVSGGDFSSDVVELMVNRAIAMIQEDREKLARALLISAFSSGVSANLPSPASLNYLRWNAGATGLENAASIDLTGTTVSGFMESLLDDADAAAARATLDLVASSFVRASVLPAADAAALRTILGLTGLATLAVSGTHGQAVHINSAGAVAFANVGPIGSIVAWPTATAPSGWLECSGAAVSRTTYATLFALIGVTYGAGDGSTTFNLPDLRGEFIRGWDHGRGVDPDAASRTNRGDGVTGDNVGTKQGYQVQAHTHTYDQPINASSPTGSGATRIEAVTPGVATGSFGGNETRPRNVNMMYVIRGL